MIKNNFSMTIPVNWITNPNLYVFFHETFIEIATDMADVTLGTSGLWPGTRTGASGTATLA